MTPFTEFDSRYLHDLYSCFDCSRIDLDCAMCSIAKTIYKLPSSLSLSCASGLFSSGKMLVEKEIVSISYHDLVRVTSCDNGGADSSFMEIIEEAFGSSGLGIVAVTDVPNFEDLRSRLLPLSHRLANLSNEQLAQVTVPDALYQVGWSHGKEKLEGEVDMVITLLDATDYTLSEISSHV